MSSLPTREGTLGQVTSLNIECSDCGRRRWRKPEDYYRKGIGASTPLSGLSAKLYCPSCRSDGFLGKNISLQAAFSTELNRLRAEAHVLRNQPVPEAELPAKRA
jgi:hypothetical protein